MNEQDLFKKLTSLHLTHEEKRFMRQNVLLHARQHGVLSPLTSLFFFTRSFVRVTALALLLLVSTTLVNGAENAVPGDALYGMKRGVNERVLGVFAQSDDAKARLETKFLDRRLEEIQIVIREDAQTDKNQTGSVPKGDTLAISEETLAVVSVLTEEAREHAKMAETHIANVSDDGDQDQALALAATLETAIDVHASTLATLTQKDAVEDDTLVAIGEAVQALSESGDDVSTLGETIAVEISKDQTAFGEKEVKEKLVQAEKLLAVYKMDMLEDDLATLSDPTLLPPSLETLVTEEVEGSTESTNEASVETETSDEEAAPSTEETFSLTASSEAVTDLALGARSNALATVYILPGVPEVEALLLECKFQFDTGEYSEAYILCSKALQTISTLVEVREKVEERNSVSVLPTPVVSETQEETVVIAKEETTKEKTVPTQNIDPTTLTGKVLNAFDTKPKY